MTTDKAKRCFLIAEVDREEKERIERIAKENDKSTGEFVRNAVRNEIAQLEKEKVA